MEALCKGTAKQTLRFHLHCLCLCCWDFFYRKGCIIKYTQMYQTSTVDGVRWKYQFTVNSNREKKFPDGRGRIGRTHWRGSDGQRRLIAGWLSCPAHRLRAETSEKTMFLKKKKRRYVDCASKKTGGLCFHVAWTQRREFPPASGDATSQEPCTQTYLIAVHMLIYSTTTSKCAFWTVTKWCFIACCIDDANYNCSSTILE